MNDYRNGIKDIVKRYKPKSGLEVGTHDGTSAKVFLDNCGGTLVSIDHHDRYAVGSRFEDEYGKRFTFLKGDSSTTMRALTRSFYDYIYIDGDHRYEGVKKDIQAALPLLKKGGVVVFDDYGVTDGDGLTFNSEGVEEAGEYGVKQAVDELMKGWKEVPTKLANGGKAFTNA